MAWTKIIKEGDRGAGGEHPMGAGGGVPTLTAHRGQDMEGTDKGGENQWNRRNERKRQRGKTRRDNRSDALKTCPINWLKNAVELLGKMTLNDIIKGVGLTRWCAGFSSERVSVALSLQSTADVPDDGWTVVLPHLHTRPFPGDPLCSSDSLRDYCHLKTHTHTHTTKIKRNDLREGWLVGGTGAVWVSRGQRFEECRWGNMGLPSLSLQRHLPCCCPEPCWLLLFLFRVVVAVVLLTGDSRRLWR